MSSNSESDDDYYGPSLPPGFQQKTSSPDTKNTTSSKSSSVRDAQIGPALPPELRARLEAEATDSKTAEETSEQIRLRTSVTDLTNESESDDDDVIGPLPPDHPKALQRSLEQSSRSFCDKKPQKREEWMLVPPKNKIIPGLGLGPRKFLTRTPMDSRKSDSEEDEEALQKEEEAAIERKMIDEYDQKMDDIKKDFETKKRRGESLLELHRQDMKKKKDEKSDKKQERKPFDRDTDLQIAGISSGDKQKYIEKSKELNSKFSRGSRKYL